MVCPHRYTLEINDSEQRFEGKRFRSRCYRLYDNVLYAGIKGDYVMANEVAFAGATGQALTFGVYTAVGVERESGTAMTETPAASGLYLGTPTAISIGNLVIIDDGTAKIGGGEYLPEISSAAIRNDLSDMDDKLDIIIRTKQSTLDVRDNRRK